MLSDPLFQDVEGWWFWDEVWADKIGPYPDKQTTLKAMSRYFQSLSTGPGCDEKGMYIHLRGEENEQ